MNPATLVMVLKWLLAHGAAIGGLVGMVVYGASMNWPMFLVSLQGAAAGFGLSLSPQIQAVLNILSKVQVDPKSGNLVLKENAL